MVGPFSSVLWEQGWYGTLTRMVQSNLNALYNRSRGDFVEIPYDDFTVESSFSVTPPTPDVTFEVKIDGSPVFPAMTATVTTGNGTIKIADKDIGVDYGLHYLEVVVDGVPGKKMRFMKREDMDLLSVWADMTTVVTGGDGDYTRTRKTYNISLMSHREVQNW